MNSHNPNGWPPGTAPGPAPPAPDQQPLQQRPAGAFGPAMPMQQGPQHQLNGPSMIQQPTSFFANQPNGHNVPSGQSLPPQASPLQSVRGAPPPPPHPQQHSPNGLPHPPSQSHFGLPALGPAMSQQLPQAMMQAEREIMQQREQQERMRQEQMQHEIAQQRYEQERDLVNQHNERQARELQARDQLQREQLQREQLQSPRETHAGAIPLQQPVASRVPATLHGPNGILNEQHLASAGQPQPAQPLGAPSGPGNVFGAGMQSNNEGALPPFARQVNQGLPGQQQLINLTNAAAPQPTNPGQQPILNDALTYLDQVKVRFQDAPDVYNRFLDIMKDFKSQAIDTPGVIERVSGLFTGHPELIQGFNTFLPPGYKIECGLDDDPNAIRVTTPMGSTVRQMPSASSRYTLNGVGGMENSRPSFYTNNLPNNDWVAQQQDIEQHETALEGGRHDGTSLFAGQSSMADGSTPYDEQAQLDVQALPAGLASNQHLLGGLEKRGPVEFNHAIGYVNKIKTRFGNQPEIYKQFLEILQTYQKESKPIQDVYAQVTQLFSSAQDLLEDFKQFLPESAAQAKAQAQAAAVKQAEDAAMLSNVRGEVAYNTGQLHNQTQTPRPELKMPPVGSFAPPSVGKDNKKRRGGAGSQMTGGAAAAESAPGPSSRNRGNVGNANKRARVDQPKPVAPEAVPVEPTLIPALPTPMAPVKDLSLVNDGITFFERVKKYLSNRQTFNEFLKLCNLFNQEIIDKETLVHKAHGFIGSNVDLMSYFKKWVLHDGNDRVIENTARVPSGKVVLSNCRGLGPSYRLLPKRERLRACGGRDDMCKSVLNDEWVSHPTWASEESGFIAHRKNGFEEALHRIEEERHDYDINIEACLRTIQLLEPIAQQIKMLTDEEKIAFRLAPGIGGQSETIFQRVIKKIYDRERGCRVVEDMFNRPTSVVPILLGRLKQKVEEWKASQREWEKVWREQTNRIFWRSLDHQGVNVKQQDKRQFQPKTLHTEILAKYEEQRRQRINPSNRPEKYQFKYDFSDLDVVYDCCHLILIYLHYSFSASDVDKTRLDSFIKTFAPTFFDIDKESFDEKMNDIEDESPPNEEIEEEANTGVESTVVRGRRGNTGKKQDLLRGVLDRSKPPHRGDGEESGASTPDGHSNDEDTPASTGTPSEQPRADPAEHRWLSHPSSGNQVADLNAPFHRDDFHLYATSNIYCFFRMFQGLYERLAKVKGHEQRVHQDVARAKTNKPAHELGLIDKTPADYFHDVDPSANYYKQIVQMCEEVSKSEMETSELEETLRRFYMEDGWQLYSFEKLLASLLRFGLSILVSDNKDKSLDIINLFYKDRKEDETTHQNELTYRKQVEKYGKDTDIYRIRYNRPNRTATIQIFKKDDKTYEADELAATARWSYYVSTYSMLDHTEGVEFADLRLPFLRRNMPFPRSSTSSSAAKKATDTSTATGAGGAGNEDNIGLLGKDFAATPMWNQDGLVMRISPNNYHILYDPYTSDWWVQSTTFRKRGLGAQGEVSKERKKGLEALFEGKERNAWMRRMAVEDVEEVKRKFGVWVREGPEALEEGKGKEVVMGGV